MLRPSIFSVHSRGFALVAFLVISFFAALIVGGTLQLLSNNTKMIADAKSGQKDFYQVESAFNIALSWLKDNSKNMFYPFTADVFYSNFERTKPGVGDNDVVITVPTTLKLKGANTTVLLSNTSDLGKPIFPKSQHIDTKAGFDAVASFQKLDFGSAVVKVSLVDGIAAEPSKDYGSPPGKKPTTDFYPIYRIDVIDSIHRKKHIYGYVVGSVAKDSSLMFIGDNVVTVNGVCDSYDSAKGPYGKVNRNAKCSMGSGTKLQINKQGKVYGEVASNKSLNVKGILCADFDSGCPNAGSKCVGASCAVPEIDKVDPWKKFCPKDQGNLVISKDTTLEVLSDAPTSSCWDTITIKNKATLTLKTTKFPYFINTIEFEHGTNSKIAISPDSLTSTVVVYLEKISGKRPNQLDGTRFINSSASPGSFQLWYIGNGNLNITRKDSLYLDLHAPEARVNVSGNLDFYGAIFSSQLVVGKNARLHGDESLSIGGSAPNDIAYSLRQLNTGYQ